MRLARRAGCMRTIAHAAAQARRPMQAADAELRLHALAFRHALPIDTPRRLVETWIRETLDARPIAGGISILVREPATVATAAVVGDQAAIAVAATAAVRHALALCRRPVEADDAQSGLDARLLRLAGVLITGTARRGADAAALVATDTAAVTNAPATGDDVGRAFEAAEVGTGLVGLALGAHGAAPPGDRFRRDAAPLDLRRGVGPAARSTRGQ